MELAQLRYLCLLDEERHFTRAAARANVAQPALSRQIRKLEEELGVPLVTRTTRRVRLTAHGTEVVQHARRALEAADAIRTVASDARGLQSGRVTLGVTHTPGPVDVAAILNYASSFGTVALSRAYADWSVPANASYRRQLVDRAVDLTQLFQATTAGKNGADIRLSVDVLEDLFRLPDLTHVLIVAGDSDYIALAQRCKRLGRFVVGVGVAGGTSPALVAACDEFTLYDAVLRVEDEVSRVEPAPEPAPAADDETAPPQTSGKLSDRAASRLLVQAVELLRGKGDDEWLHAAAVKQQIKRLDPSFDEKQLDFGAFTDFVASRGNLVELREDGNQRLVRLRPAKPARKPAARKS